MSSHHIVREKQEPALLVLGIGNFSYELLGQLLEWSPTVIAAPDSYEELNSDDIKVDWLITGNEHDEPQNDVHIIRSFAGNYLADALKELINKGYAAVNIISHFADVSMLAEYINHINVVIYAGNEKTFPIRAGYQKWMPKGETISIITPLNGINTSGLEKLSGNEYKTTKDGIISINFAEGYIFITERL